MSHPNLNDHTNHSETLRNRCSVSESEIDGIASPRSSNASREASKVPSSIDANEEKIEKSTKVRRMMWKVCVYLVTIGMLISLLIGLNMSWSAITAALVLMVLDFKDARPCLEKTSYSLLIFFCGMFITIDDFNKTGLPSAVWDFMEPYAKIDHVSGIALLSIVILTLSNLASNLQFVIFFCGILFFVRMTW